MNLPLIAWQSAPEPSHSQHYRHDPARLKPSGWYVDIESFIGRWKASGGSERANFQQFAIELTQLLDVPAPKAEVVMRP
ncbi:hypothetical protein [Paracoccus sp. SJTW-4]|uniref:hypothetical protein n=1 Tax=Paracoccus sp. SJTW-4 TaxID=3078428 RepID=UPI0039ED795E